MIAIGSDHAGFPLKEIVINYLKENNYEYIDCGTYDLNSTDYPIYAKKVCRTILAKEADKGILICGTGVGISMTANKFKGIRCALCNDLFTVRLTREHNDANVLAMGERVIGAGLALDIVETFLKTEFSNDIRHIKRINQIEED